ncbi:MAG: hypothetical protein EHM35_02275 [Planctomycetaceae bacterium]|nr:MAG: hypothetical protein EHM35_02275 [Planctomycetaceae bacterium]
MTLSRRHAMGTLVGGVAAGPEMLKKAATHIAKQRAMAATPMAFAGETVGGDNYPQNEMGAAKEPSIADLREVRSSLEAQARGEGYDPRNFPMRGPPGYDANIEMLRSVSPNAKRLFQQREDERRCYENYVKRAQEQLASFVKQYAWRLL